MHPSGLIDQALKKAESSDWHFLAVRLLVLAVTVTDNESNGHMTHVR
jgi:hypothetical protein